MTKKDDEDAAFYENPENRRLGATRVSNEEFTPNLLEYSSNNSGGNWWLVDDDWKNLEAAGWTVEWVKDSPFHQQWSSTKGKDRFLGALATSASKIFPSAKEGVAEWERITSQDANALGCYSCCGNPHDFTWTDVEGEPHHSSVDAPSTASSRSWG